MSITSRTLLRLNPLRTSFLLCDTQSKFSSDIFGYQSLLTTTKKLLTAAEVLNIPLIVTEQYPQVLGNTDKELDISRASLIHGKTSFSMLTPEVKSNLKLKDINSIVLFGIASHVCILQTTLDLLRQNYQFQLVMDAISAANRTEINPALERLHTAGATLTTSTTLLYELLQNHHHLIEPPQSDAILKIIKENSKNLH